MKKNLLVTPSYAPDFERCRALIESTEKWVRGFDEHLVLVDKSDLKLFSTLQTNKVRVICKEELLPISLRQIPCQKRWWVSNCSLPTRGWIIQQIMKLALAEASHSDAVIFADSDLVFMRHLDMNELWSNNRLRLFRSQRGPMQYLDRRYKNWYQFSAKALGLGDEQKLSGAYITQLATMRPDIVRSLCAHLESRFQKPWYQVLLNTWDFSEYVLYGVFVEKLLQEQQGHYLEDSQLCHSSWFYDIKSQQDIENFVANANAGHRAIHLQSNLGLLPETLNNTLASANKAA